MNRPRKPAKGELRISRKGSTDKTVSLPFLGCLLVLLPVSYLLVFVLPWSMPVKGPIVSESYTFGFSNVTAHLGLALTLAVLFGIRLFMPDLAARDRMLADGLIGAPAGRSRSMTITTLLCIGFSVGVVGGWWHTLPFGYFGESTYFLTRLDRMTIGQVPFRDFDFGYGPAMLWLPFLIHEAAHGFLAMDTAYIATVLMHFTLGILALDYIVSCLHISQAWRAGLMAFATVATLNITLGVIYTPLRFVYALWAVLFLHNTLRSSPAWKSCLFCFVLPFAGLLLSPDSGLVTCIATVVGLLWCLRTGERTLVFRALAVGGSVVLVLALFGMGYFKMILFFGGGAYNFPILPTPYILSILFSACWLLPRLAASGWTSRDQTAPVSASLLVALGLFLPAALGRCDPGHVLLNGMGILIIAVAAAVYEKRFAIKIAAIVAALAIFITNQIGFWNHYDALIKNVFATRKALAENRHQRDEGESLVQSSLSQESKKQRFDWAKRVPFGPDLLDLLRYDSIATPIGAAEDIDRFLKASGRYVPEFFVPPYGGTFTPETVAQKLEELKKSDILLVPQSALGHLQQVDVTAYGRSWSEFMSRLFVYPVNLLVANQPYTPDAVIMRALAVDFAVEARFRDYLILRRKTNLPKT